jgi:hypothetical protein
VRILFAPDYPDREMYALSAIMHRLDYTATRRVEDAFDAAMLWRDATAIQAPAKLEAVAARAPVLNLRCLDIGKTRVEAKFRAVFGYDSLVDPRIYEGLCIRKANENARRLDTVVKCPIEEPDSTFVYQKLIDATVDGVQIEYRVPVILGEIPVVYRVGTDLPGDGPLKTRRRLPPQPIEPEAVFDAGERRRLLDFAARMGLDVGDLDVLRARADGRLYVLDANRTPAGFGMLNPFNWRMDERARALDALAESFDRRLRAHIAGYTPDADAPAAAPSLA